MLAHLLPLLLLVVGSFVGVWISAGRIVSTITTVSHTWKISPFTLSVLVLGAATSLPEIAVAASSVALGTPQLSLGSLVGGQALLLLGIIPLLGLLNHGIAFRDQLEGRSLFLVIALMAGPTVTLLDQQLHFGEGCLLILLYSVFAVSSFRTMTWKEKVVRQFKIKVFKPSNSISPLWMVLSSTSWLIVLIGSSFASTWGLTQLATWLPFSSFGVGAVILALGTNLPELSLILRATWQKSSQVALGDYVGSAGFNTLLVGCIGLLGRESSIQVQIPMTFATMFLVGLGLFWVFGTSKRILSKVESSILLTLYGLTLFLSAS